MKMASLTDQIPEPSERQNIPSKIRIMTPPPDAPANADSIREADEITYVDRKMAFICSKGNLDMAYPALIMAHSALNAGVHVDIFFTFWGLDIINKRTMDRLKFTMQGNAAIHFPTLEKYYPGLGDMHFSPSLGVLPGMTKLSTWYMKNELQRMEIPPVRDMLEQIAQLGANLWACKLSADMMKLTPRHLHKSVRGIVDADTFIEMSEGAQIIFI